MFDIKLTAHLAELSKLKFTDEELLKITKEMDDIVSLMDTVGDFNESDFGEVITPESVDNIRRDEIKPSMQREDVLSNAKNKQGAFFSVPKVV